jgi:hypothetical protein
MAAQWFALPKLFSKSVNEGYQVVRSDDKVLQFKNEQTWRAPLVPKDITINALVTLSLDPETVNTPFERLKYMKDQANDKDYSHEGVLFSLKKFQADNLPKVFDPKEVEYFKKDDIPSNEEPVRRWGSGKEEGSAPKGNYSSGPVA